jgi:hypothetical protein
MPAGQGNSTVDGWLDGSSPQPPERKRSTPNPCRGPPGFSERRVEPMKPCLGRRLNAIKHPASNRRHHHHPAHLSGVPLSTEQGRGLASATAASALRARPVGERRHHSTALTSALPELGLGLCAEVSSSLLCAADLSAGHADPGKTG